MGWRGSKFSYSYTFSCASVRGRKQRVVLSHSRSSFVTDHMIRRTILKVEACQFRHIYTSDPKTVLMPTEIHFATMRHW